MLLQDGGSVVFFLIQAQPAANSTPAVGSGAGASALVSGVEIENTVSQLMELGFEKEQVMNIQRCRKVFPLAPCIKST